MFEQSLGLRSFVPMTWGQRDEERLAARIDEACEQCHMRFWYPDSPPPPTAMR